MLLTLLIASPLVFSQTSPEGDVYPLATCLVSGEKLGGMGEAVIYSHEGREIRFCCKSCIPKFTKSPATYIGKLDAQIILEQTPRYPFTTCLVSKEKLEKDAVDYVYKNRLLRFCCKGCIKKFLKEPGKYLAELNKAVIAKQQAVYPLKRCLVTGETFTDAEAVNFVQANRLIRFCCKDCIKKFRQDPVKYFRLLDEAGKKTETVAPHDKDKEEHDKDKEEHEHHH
jgi:YHS domain-containing protein